MNDFSANEKSFWLFYWFIKPTLEFSKRHGDSFGTQHFLFACFAIIYYGIPFLFWSNSSGAQPTDSIILCTIASGLSFMLIFKDSIFEKYQLYFTLYWYLVLFFCLPFLSTYMLLKQIVSFPWLFFSFFLLGILVDWMFFVVLTILGAGLAVLLVGFNQDIFYPNLNYTNQTFTAYTVVFIIVIISLFLRNRDRTIYERISAYQDLSGYVAHEMRKPLAFINASCDGWINNSKYLFDAYETSIDLGLCKESINPVVLNSMKILPVEFKKTSRDGLLFIEMLLMQTQPLDTNTDFCLNSAINCVRQAIEKWECGINKIIKINLNTNNDFNYFGSLIFLSHILLELCRNSEYFIDKNKEAKVDIWCEKQGNCNEIHFKDNGQGIDKDNLKKIFDYRFSTRRYGTGIGLKFCKKVMQQMGGNIDARSEKGKYTEFILRFPIC